MSVATSPFKAAAPAATDGAARMVFRRGEKDTRLARLYQRAPLRALFPTGENSGLATAVLVTTSGGLVGGDRLAVGIVAEEGSAALATTQAAEKVYRSLGADCRVEVELSAAAGSWLEWLPHETILFEGARLDRVTRIDYAPGARVLAGEILVFGRHARGETLTCGRLRDAWEVRRQGRLIWADALVLAGDLAAVLAAPACFAGAVAMATVIYAGGGLRRGAFICPRLDGWATGGRNGRCGDLRRRRAHLPMAGARPARPASRLWRVLGGVSRACRRIASGVTPCVVDVSMRIIRSGTILPSPAPRYAPPSSGGRGSG